MVDQAGNARNKGDAGRRNFKNRRRMRNPPRNQGGRGIMDEAKQVSIAIWMDK